MDVILPSDGADSMLNAMFNDLDTVSKAFASMAGIPSDVTSSITSSIKSLKETASKVSSATSTSGKNNTALKSQLTSGVAKQLDTKIAAMAKSDPTKFAENKTSICDAYKTMTASAVPTACN
jgi:hypothetical protein